MKPSWLLWSPEATIWASFLRSSYNVMVTRNGCHDNSGYLNSYLANVANNNSESVQFKLIHFLFLKQKYVVADALENIDRFSLRLCKFWPSYQVQGVSVFWKCTDACFHDVRLNIAHCSSSLSVHMTMIPQQTHKCTNKFGQTPLSLYCSNR